MLEEAPRDTKMVLLIPETHDGNVVGLFVSDYRLKRHEAIHHKLCTYEREPKEKECARLFL